MAKSSLEKAIEKQQREAKKMADQEARRQRASAIVNGQPQIGGMRIMDQAAEEVFKAVLSCYDGNEKRYVHSNCDVIPEAHQNSLLLEFEKLTTSSLRDESCCSNCSFVIWGGVSFTLRSSSSSDTFFSIFPTCSTNALVDSSSRLTCSSEYAN